MRDYKPQRATSTGPRWGNWYAWGMNPIDTKQVTTRRDIAFATLDDLSSEARRIAEAEAAGTARALGNWSPGQNLQHLARFMTCSLDGFGEGLPLPLKLLGRGLRLFLGKKLLKNAPPPGFKLPKGMRFVPDDEVSAADGARELCAVIDRVRGGEGFIPASPLLGKLSREQWIELHLRHAELHLSFVGLDQ